MAGRPVSPGVLSTALKRLSMLLLCHFLTGLGSPVQSLASAEGSRLITVR